MCGIVGYIGERTAYPILVSGLHRLEYRGYDSAGVALLNGDHLNVYRAKGKVSDLETAAGGKDCMGTVGIAHTRWATHGEPSVKNAHPHQSESGNLALVHNGIIENFSVLRDQLISKGYHFSSDTDTEVLVQLIEYYERKQRCDLVTAVRYALNKVIGAYAIAVIDRRHPDMLIAARKSSPLVVGIGENEKEYFIASDATPIAEYTKHVVYIEDGQIVKLIRGGEMEVTNLRAEHVEVDVTEIDMDINMLEKDGFPHYMLKEIFDQPKCLEDCMRGRLEAMDRRLGIEPDGIQYGIKLSAVSQYGERLMQAGRLIIVACGTSWHAGLIGKQLFETFCGIPVQVEYASEFRYRNPVIKADDVVIAISQSGETADTLAAIELARQYGALVFGIVNAVGSSIARNTDTGTYIHVGPEIGVASTKAFTGQLTVLTMLALALGHKKGNISDGDFSHYTEELSKTPMMINEILKQNDRIADIAKVFTYAHNFIYLGRGWNYPVALEGALKLKEISYIHAEGYPAAEMKHGPIALIDSDMPVLFVATHHQQYQKIISNMQEVKARGGRIIAVVTAGDEEVRSIADQVIEVPQTLNFLAPLLSVIPLQLLAYHVAVHKGLNVDQPRNLAKSVTVE